MYRNVVTALTLVSFLLMISGCYSEREITRSSLEGDETGITKVITVDGDTVSFSSKYIDSRGGIVRDSAVFGIKENGDVTKIPLSRVDRVYLTKTNYFTTSLLTVGVIFGVLLVVGIIAYGSGPNIQLKFD